MMPARGAMTKKGNILKIPRRTSESARAMAERITRRVFALSDDIRYVAMYRNGKLESISKPDSEGASSWESDKYEEIIVNPTLVTLLGQRASIDCGGVLYIVIQYGNFTQVVHPIRGGHLSVAFESGSDYQEALPAITRLVERERLQTHPA